MRQYEIILNQVIGIQYISNNCIDFIIAQSAGAAVGHGAFDVIISSGQMRPVGTDGFQRIFMIQRIRPACQFWPIVYAFGEIPVAGRTFFGENLFAYERVTGALGQAIALHIDVPIPGGNFGGQSGPAQAKFFGHDRRSQAGSRQSDS